MQAFQFYIQDDRYTVPTLLFVEARSPERARAIAERHLRSSPHFSGIDVYLDDKRLFGVSAACRSGDQSNAPAA
jgi:hypothetical protein